MSKFKIGDIIKATTERYMWTSKSNGFVGVITEVYNGNDIEVETLESNLRGDVGESYRVGSEGFELVTKSRFPVEDLKDGMIVHVDFVGFGGHRYDDYGVVIADTIQTSCGFHGKKTSPLSAVYNPPQHRYILGDIMENKLPLGCELIWKREEEPKPKQKLTCEEIGFLKGLNINYNYIARDGDGKLWVYEVCPTDEGGDVWDNCFRGKIEWLDDCDLFTFITWDDDEPYRIADLLGDCE